MRKTIGIVLIILGVGVLTYVAYRQSKSTATRTYSEYSIMVSAWERYKPQFILPEGRVIDRTQNNITTSEGQSYAMLRAVWVDDKATFDKVWTWTKQNLKRPSDNLLGWRWGERQDGKYGFLENGGENAAADADIDIALALIFAGERWNDDRYTAEARKLLKSIWELQVDNVAFKNYVVAGNWAKGAQQLVVNPSYFAPYAWRIFAEVDPEHDWLSLIDPAYELLDKVGREPLDKGRSVGLPPDWVSIDRSTGALTAPSNGNLKTDYSFDAMRVPFRVALDYLWFEEPRAREYLTNSLAVLGEKFENEGKLPMIFAHHGDVLNDSENPSMYGTAMGYFKIVKPELAEVVYEQKILKLYASDKNSFNSDLPYYDQNWLWFGTALYNDFLINLYQNE